MKTQFNPGPSQNIPITMADGSDPARLRRQEAIASLFEALVALSPNERFAHPATVPLLDHISEYARRYSDQETDRHDIAQESLRVILETWLDVWVRECGCFNAARKVWGCVRNQARRFYRSSRRQEALPEESGVGDEAVPGPWVETRDPSERVTGIWIVAHLVEQFGEHDEKVTLVRKILEGWDTRRALRFLKISKRKFYERLRPEIADHLTPFLEESRNCA